MDNNMKARKITPYITTNTFIVILGILAIAGFAVYFYQQYTSFKTALTGQDKKMKEQYMSQCPDYWEIDSVMRDTKGKVTGVKCKNVQFLGDCAIQPGANSFTFDDEIFTNPKTMELSRCKWAKQCGVSWSGYDRKC